MIIMQKTKKQLLQDTQTFKETAAGHWKACFKRCAARTIALQLHCKAPNDRLLWFLFACLLWLLFAC